MVYLSWAPLPSGIVYCIMGDVLVHQVLQPPIPRGTFLVFWSERNLWFSFFIYQYIPALRLPQKQTDRSSPQCWWAYKAWKQTNPHRFHNLSRMKCRANISTGESFKKISSSFLKGQKIPCQIYMPEKAPLSLPISSQDFWSKLDKCLC